MEFYLTGPNQGKTLRLGGFQFVNGVTDVPDKAEDAQNLLRLFYAAHPGHLLAQDADGKLAVKEVAQEHRAPLLMPREGRVPPPGQMPQVHQVPQPSLPSSTPPLPNAVQELPGGQKMDEAGGVGAGKGKSK